MTAARPSRSATGARRRLVVVGTGMAAQAAVEAALAHRAPDRWEVTMLGSEPDAPYNRIMLSQVLAGTVAERETRLREPSWFRRRGVDLRTATTVTGIDVEGRAVGTAAGESLPYDGLLLATGSRPLLPPIEGIEREGVHVFRTLADARAILAAARPGGDALVVGGGLLGLEAARGLRERGMRVSVVHLVDRLMETQLDDGAGRLLDRQMRQLGVRTLMGRETTAVLGADRARGLRFSSGEEIAAEMVVLAVGIRPEVELARGAGIEVGRGVLVDDELRTSAPGVWAVGECAEHRGTVYGLWAPLQEQARAAGASVAGRPAAFHGATPATTLKVMGADLFVAGAHSARDDDEHEVVSMDTRSLSYRKLVLRDGRLQGAIVLGEQGLSPQLAELLRSGDEAPEALLAAGLGGPAAGEPPRDDQALVCHCNGVSGETILAVARDRDLTRVEQVSRATRAGSGCGSCRVHISALLERLGAERERLRDGEPHAGRLAAARR